MTTKNLDYLPQGVFFRDRQESSLIAFLPFFSMEHPFFTLFFLLLLLLLVLAFFAESEDVSQCGLGDGWMMMILCFVLVMTKWMR